MCLMLALAAMVLPGESSAQILCGGCAGTPLDLFLCALPGSVSAGPSCLGFPNCHEPTVSGPYIQTVPVGGDAFEVRLAVDVIAPDNLIAANPLKLKIWWREGSPATNPTVNLCQRGDADRQLTYLSGPTLTCGDLPASLGEYSLRARVCGEGDCSEFTDLSGMQFFVPRSALSCDEPRKWGCNGDASCDVCLGPQGGTGPGGGPPGVAPPGSGPDARLYYRAGGAGSDGSPGRDAWRAQLGRFWSHDYALRIFEDPDPSHVWLVTEHATYREFTDGDMDGAYETVSPSDEYRPLTYTGSGWELAELDGTVHSFDAAGRWLGKSDRNGNATVATYDGSGRLTAVSFPDQRREDFFYEDVSGKLERIEEVGIDGTTKLAWLYAWAGFELTSITRPDGTRLEFEYGEPRYPGYMTRMRLRGIQGGLRVLAAWEYDDWGNVVKTWRGDESFDGPDAVDKWELFYDDPVLPGLVTVRDPLWNPATPTEHVATYTMGRDQASDKPRIEALSGDCPACSTGPNTQLFYLDPPHHLRPSLVRDGNGVETAFDYDDFGQVVSRIDAANDPGNHPDLPRETTWQHHPAFPAFPTVIEGPVTTGQTATRRVDLAYDGTNGDLLSRTHSGSEATYPTGSFALVTGYPDYNAAGQVETVDPPGYGTTDQTTFTYDPARGDLLPLTRQDSLLAQPTQFGYDPFNRRSRVTDPNGVMTETEYDGLDRIERIIRRSDGSTLPTPPSDADLVTEYIYNQFGDLFQVVLSEGNVIEYGYDAAGRLVSVERKPDVATAGERTSYTLDGAGNRTREELQRWTGAAWETVGETQFVFATRCQLDQVIQAPGAPEQSVTDYAYDCSGNLVDLWDGNHDRGTEPATSHYEYDELDRLVEVRQPWAAGGEAVTTYGYDVQDHLTTVFDAEGNLTAYAYSDRDLLTEENSQVSGTTTHTYNDHGELTSSEDARGATTARTVDALDRVLDVTFSLAEVEEPPIPWPLASSVGGDGLAGSSSIGYSYDTAPPSCGAQEDFPIGRLASITRDGETIEYCFDRFGRVTRDGELAYGYDENGNRATIGYPGGVTATYTHDRADRPLSLVVDDGVNPPQSVASAATYEPFGPLSGLMLGNGLVETRDFDGRYEPTGIAGGGLLDWTYTTDRVGNILSIADELPGGEPARSFSYQDPQYFLTGGSGPWGGLSWTYDRIGNRLTETRDAGPPDAYAYVQNSCTPPGRPGRPCPGNTAILDTVTLGGGGSRVYTFDPAGHLETVTAGANTVHLNVGADGRLLGISRPAADESAEFEYDGRSFLSRARDFAVTAVVFADGFETGDLGCWSEIVGGVAVSGSAECFSNEARRTRPLYDTQGLLNALRRRPDQFSPEATLLVFYFAGRPVAQLDLPAAGGTTFTYLTTDHLGTPVLATDSTGALTWRGGFEPFGTDWQEGDPSGASENGVFLRLPGQWQEAVWHEASLGVPLYYNVHRWYQPGVGRYTRVDPVDKVSAAYAALLLVHPDNLYTYALQRPLVLVDPLGLRSDDPVGCVTRWVAAGAVVGAGVGATVGATAGGAAGATAGGVGAGAACTPVAPGVGTLGCGAAGAAGGGAAGAAGGAAGGIVPGGIIGAFVGGVVGILDCTCDLSLPRIFRRDRAPDEIDCRKIKQLCIEKCTEETLPTGTFDGAPFFKCLRQCLDSFGC